MICCKTLYELPGKCSDFEIDNWCFGPYLNSCLLDTEVGLLVVRSNKSPLCVNEWSCKQCVCVIDMYTK